MAEPIHVPAAVGRAALAELDRVRWAELDHAYGTGKVSRDLHGDVEGSLRRLGDADPGAISDAIWALFGNIYHQGTIYEATAYAVPFVAAVAAGPEIPAASRRELVMLLGEIALASTFETDDGTMAGAFGDGVAEATGRALAAARPHVEAIARRPPALAAALEALLAAIDGELAAARSLEQLHVALESLEELDVEEEERRTDAETGPAEWFRHPVFGPGVLVAREASGYRIRFANGRERVIKPTSLVAINPPSA
jgi:hypothetical protein